ncbi:MAG TPA: right-handed parallel beta-helix repeat-containing protein [Anaerolineae bacterium]|nr:right-handed parallel beta-helix repeat-containing protein [Anaerolineae bacterium]
MNPGRCFRLALALCVALGVWLLMQPMTARAETITVTNTLDDGSAGSLRAVIAAANPGATIIFDDSLSGLTITLSSQLAIAKNLTIDGSALPVTLTLSGNHAVRILFISNNTRVTLNRLRFVAGAVSIYYDGGGLYMESGAVVTLTHSAVLSCTAGIGGGIYNENGALTVQDSTVAGNSANDRGGGIGNLGWAATLTVQDSTVAGNSASYDGGGIYNAMGALTVQDSTFHGNSAGSRGGGLYSEEGALTVQDSTFYGNSAWDGGGLYSYNDNTRTVQNSTFTANRASLRGGGLYAFRSLTLQNCTVAGNAAGNYGGGLYGDFTLHNTILWGNTAPNDAQMCTSGATIYSSVVQGGCPASAACTNLITADPRLGALGDYGGSTLTEPLLPGSSALDAGNDAACLLTDQRGVTRPRGAHCDIGAFEVADRAITVDDDYTAGTPGWNIHAFSSLQAGLNAVSSGGSITVSAGFYPESAALTKTVAVTLTGDVVLTGSLTLLRGTFNVGTNTLTVGGDLMNNWGVLAIGDGALTLAGSAPQTLDSAGTLTLNELTIANTSGLTPAVKLKTDAVVNGALTLQSGALGIYAETLTLNGPVHTIGGSMARQPATTVYAQAAPGQAVAPGQYGHLTFNDQPKTLPDGGTVAVRGNFDPGAGGGHTVAGSTVAFDGAGAQTIANAVTLHNVTVGDGVTLTTAAVVAVNGTLSNAGWTRETRPVVGAGALVFGLAGLTVDVGTPGGLTGLDVVRRDANHPQATGSASSGTATGRYWAITPVTTTAAAFSATLSLPHTLGASHAQAQVCRYDGPAAPGAHWNCARTGSDAASVWRAGVAHFSEWAAGANVNPTAVGVRGVTSLGGTLLLWGGAALLALSMAGLFHRVQERRLRQ